MKKIALLLSVLLSLTVAVSAIPAAAVEIPPEASFFGDADLDGAVRANDARLILRAAAKIEPLRSGTAMILADMDGNGKVDSADARLALRAASKTDPLRKGERPDAPAEQTTQDAPDEPAVSTPATQAPTDETTTAPEPTEGTTAAAPSDAAQNAALLARFGEVMQTTKAQVRGYAQTTWDELDELDIGAATSLIKGIAEDFFRSKENAEPVRSADPDGLPPYGALPDASAVLSSSLRDNGDGTETVSLTLKDEKNAAAFDAKTGACASAAGRLFPVEDRDDLEFTVRQYAAKIPYASADLIGLTYTGCTVSCTYDAATGRAVAISRRMPVRADVHARLAIASIDGHALVTVCDEFTGFRYDDVPEPSTKPTIEPTTAGPVEPTTAAPRPAGQNEALPTTAAEILAKYKEVMDNTKKTVKTYDKLDWTEVPELNVGSISGAVKNIIDGVIPGKDAAEPQDDRDDRGKQIPPVNEAGVGCGLTDARAVKAASCVDNGDGTATIVIVLNDERDPEPMDMNTGACSSDVGGIFPCISRSAVIDTMNGESVGFSLEDLHLDYKDCSVVLTYDAVTDRAAQIEYTAPCTVSGSIRVLTPIELSACLENHVIISDLKY